MSNEARRSFPVLRRLAWILTVWIGIGWIGMTLQAAEPLGLPAADPAASGFDRAKLLRISVEIERLIAERKLAGATVVIARDGRVVYADRLGQADVEADRPIDFNTRFRIASMTKPITSVAALMLVEDGALALDDPVAKYIREFAEVRVAVPTDEEEGGSTESSVSSYRDVPLEEPVRVRDLLTHTSGLMYRFVGRPHFGALYEEAGIHDGLAQTELTLAENVRNLARLPLRSQPGQAWEYSLSTDVLGRVVEVASGMSLDAFFAQRIFEPLGMRETAFYLKPSETDRLAAIYEPGPDLSVVRTSDRPVRRGALVYSAGYPFDGPQVYFSGGAGLTSTAPDYLRFCQMLLNGGTLDDQRILKAETVALMTRDQIGSLTPSFSVHGTGFGYGFGVVRPEEAASGESPASAGTYSWGGIFNTYFWVDPETRIVGLFMSQLYPFGHLSIRQDIQRLTYEALTESTPDQTPR